MLGVRSTPPSYKISYTFPSFLRISSTIHVKPCIRDRIYMNLIHRIHIYTFFCLCFANESNKQTNKQSNQSRFSINNVYTHDDFVLRTVKYEKLQTSFHMYIKVTRNTIHICYAMPKIMCTYVCVCVLSMSMSMRTIYVAPRRSIRQFACICLYGFCYLFPCVLCIRCTEPKRNARMHTLKHMQSLLYADLPYNIWQAFQNLWVWLFQYIKWR